MTSPKSADTPATPAGFTNNYRWTFQRRLKKQRRAAMGLVQAELNKARKAATIPPKVGVRHPEPKTSPATS
jgi:hypothetical protein